MYVSRKCRCSSCRKAWSDYRREYNKKRKGWRSQYEAEYRKRNRVSILAREADYRVANREKMRAYGIEYKRRYKDALLAKQRTTEGKAKRRMIASSRRARLRGQFVEDVDPRVVYEMHDGHCGICDESVSAESFDVDHVTPIARGGMHCYANVQLAHPACNKSKGAS
jgi:5-methylcytosine-specific restriction endonuclease McrA